MGRRCIRNSCYRDIIPTVHGNHLWSFMKTLSPPRRHLRKAASTAAEVTWLSSVAETPECGVGAASPELLCTGRGSRSY